ncbi:putative cytochrome P450 [Rosellinia necatrix]|uniref:Putative cytochrome P450 n=1 Tax=Rosellinia necatrix TaxID=77044 RepID=A0A1W2TAH3_ROSNE|nr:putative cytochrome P450 [Rosellinia necatrix]
MLLIHGFLLVAVAVAVCALLLRLIIGPRGRNNESALWTRLDAVGVTSGGLFPWGRAIAASIVHTRTFANEGYASFSKVLGKPYALPTTWTGKAMVVVPPSQIHQLLTRPDKQADGEITNIQGLIETVQMPFVISDPNIYQNTIHFDVVRKKMAKKDMHFFAPITEDEIVLAYDKIWGLSNEWKTINGWDACGKVIACTAQRILLGLPLCRNERLLKSSRLYANSVLLGAALMNCFPPLLRKFIGPVIALRARYYQAQCVSMLVPMVKGRLSILSAPKENKEMPEDFLQWLIVTAAKDSEEQVDATRIANRLIALMTPLIFAVCYVFAHAVLDVYGSPDKKEFINGLSAECKQVLEKHGDLRTPEAVNSLHRIDSTIRESMRTSDVAVTNLFRDVTVGEVSLGFGINVTQGVRMAFPTQSIHLDPEYYADPKRFDAFRFSRPFEGFDNADRATRAQERELIVTPTLTFLPLGYGRHACPGRWFAAQTMKQALAYIVLNYDVELIGKPIVRKALVNTMVPPIDAQMRIRRKTR